MSGCWLLEMELPDSVRPSDDWCRGMEAAKKAVVGEVIGWVESSRKPGMALEPSGNVMFHFTANDRMMSMHRAANGWLTEMVCKSCMPWLRLFAATSDGRLSRWMVLAVSTQLQTVSDTRRRPEMARSAFIMLEI